MDDIFTSLQPTEEPAAPVAPVVEPPVETPPAPEVPPASAEQADTDEWSKVAEDMFPGLGDKKESDNGQTDTGKKPEEIGADQGDTQKKDGDAAAGDGDAAGAGGGEKKPGDEATAEDEQAGPPELSASDLQQLESTVKAEVAQRMFTEEVNGKSVVTTPDGSKYYLDQSGRPMLADADGDPIRGIDDVMKLVNPRTGEPFTEEQAGMWLLNAQSRMRDNVSDMNSRVEEIASTGISMKQESEQVAWQYGELLKAMPDLQKELWDQYEQTLIKDPKTGIVTKAPVSLQKFYETALEPYAALARRLETQGDLSAPGTPAAPPAPATPTPAVQEQQRQQRRQDRSDIYGGGKVDDVSDEAKEWGAAAQAVFGDQLKDLRR